MQTELEETEKKTLRTKSSGNKLHLHCYRDQLTANRKRLTTSNEKTKLETHPTQ